MSREMNRRLFIKSAAAMGVTAGTFGLSGCAQVTQAFAKPAIKRISPNEKLNIGVVGTFHRAAENIRQIEHENIVAITDVDQTYLDQAAKRIPGVQTYTDWRKMLEQPNIDAVLVATPDHTHVVAAIAAVKLGKHIYCEKPMGHNIHEVRALCEAVKEYGVASQLGTQIHAEDNYRRVVEVVKSGAIGAISEVHVWVGKDWSGPTERPLDTPPVPGTLAWDLWLGPAPERPYHSAYLPQEWRRWWDFGGGTLADMGCHYIDVVFWALDLAHPLSAEAFGPPVNKETAPANLKVRWEFPKRGEQPPVTLWWYDGNERPTVLAEKKIQAPDAGVLFVGEKGMMLANYSMYQLLPEDQFKGYTPPPAIIPSSIGHHKEWIMACKTGSPTTCNFGYSGPLTETVLLGNVAYRSGKKIEWDSKKLKAKNAPEADQYISREYRKGWSL